MSLWERLTGAVLVGLLAASVMAHTIMIVTAKTPAAAEQELSRAETTLAQQMAVAAYPEQGLINAIAAYPEVAQAVAEQR